MSPADYLTSAHVPTWSPAYDDPTYRALTSRYGDPYAPPVPMTPATGIVVIGELA